MSDRATRRESTILAACRSLFHDNPISLRRFSIFTSSFVLAAGCVADGHSKYSRNLGLMLAAHGKPNGKRRQMRSKRRRAVDYSKA